MKRLVWVDALKGFGIFCVTLGHLSCHKLLEAHIYSFHMFLFFFLSGFVRKDAEGYIAKKTKTLLIPFLAWNVLSVLIGCLVSKDIIQSLRLLVLLDGEVCWNAPIWFLLLLYMVELTYTLIKRFVPCDGHISIPVLIVLWILLPEKNVFLKLNILPVCLLFYILGNLSRPAYEKQKENIFGNYKFLLPVCGLLLGMSVLFGVCLNDKISFTSPQFGNVLFCFVSGVTGVLFYVLLFQKCRFLGESKVLTYLGRNSLIIMAAQYWLFYLYDFVLAKLGRGSIWYYRSSIKALVMSVGTIMIICTALQILKKLGKKSKIVNRICLWLGVR